MKASLDHLKQILQSPALAGAAQEQMNRRRMADVEAALRVRPHFLPVQHTLPAAAASLPVSQTTDELNHDIIVIGAITDGEDRNIRFYRNIEGDTLVRVGSQQGTRLSLDAIAGHSVESAGAGGIQGVLGWPEPLLLREGRNLTLDVYQETSPGSTETVTTCFCAQRVYKPEADEATLTKAERQLIVEHIKRRAAPEIRYEVIPVAFDADGFATVASPKADEPLLCVGFRTTFSHASVKLGFDGGNGFSKSWIPIWALAAEKGNRRTLYEYLRTPLYMPAGQQLLFDLKNTIDSTSGLVAPDGNLEMIMRTV